MMCSDNSDIRLTAKVAATSLLLAVAGCTTGAAELDNSALGSNAGNKWPITNTRADELNKGVLGSEFGENLDRGNLKTALLGEFEALDKGQTGNAVTWQGSNFVTGKITPQQVFEVGGARCRRYQHVILQGGKKRSAIGTACKDDEGSWIPLV